MGKRKAEEKEAKIRRKIRKLEEKLAPTRRRIMRLPSTSSDENDEVNQPQNDALCDSLPMFFDTTTVHDDEAGQRPDIALSLMDATPSPGTAIETLPVSQNGGADPAVAGIEGSDLELDGAILSLLGDAPESNTELGPPIHKDIATRWQDILKKGLKDDIKKDLIKLYPIPNNLECLEPPILNPEVKAALTEPLVKRDFAIFNRQKQTGFALSALGRSVDSIINDPTKSLQNETKSALLRPLSDACRILCDLYQLETKRRRIHILNSINSTMKDIVMDTVPGKFLFGDNMSEKLKTAQGINRSGQILKVIPNRASFSNNSNKNTLTAAPSNVKSLNQKSPYQKTAARSYMGKQRLQDRAATAPAPTSSRQRHYRRSPPPPAPRRQRQQRY